MKTKYPMTYVKWIDSGSYANQYWHEIKNHDTSILDIETVEFLVHEDQSSVTLALCVSKNDNMIGDMTIPKVAILKRKTLDAER